MVPERPRAVLDTNVLVSAIVYGGLPRATLALVLDKKIIGVTSPALLAELLEVLRKRFFFSVADLKLLERQIKKKFTAVQPAETLGVLKDLADNRVLEAAYEGRCGYIVTGDKELLGLKQYKDIQILTPNEFLRVLKN